MKKVWEPCSVRILEKLFCNNETSELRANKVMPLSLSL